MENDSDDNLLWKELILVFATFFLPGFLFQTQAGSGRSFDDPMYSVSILLQAIPQTLLLLYIVETGKKGNLEVFGFRMIRWRDLPLAALVLAATFAVLVPLEALLDSPAEQTFEWNFDNGAAVPLVLAATLAAAYREEVFFRAYALTRLGQLGASPVAAAVGTSVVFAFGHLYQGLSGFAVSLAIGLLMCGVFVRTKNLHAVGVGHGLYNFVVILASGAG